MPTHFHHLPSCSVTGNNSIWIGQICHHQILTFSFEWSGKGEIPSFECCQSPPPPPPPPHWRNDTGKLLLIFRLNHCVWIVSTIWDSFGFRPARERTFVWIECRGQGSNEHALATQPLDSIVGRMFQCKCAIIIPTILHQYTDRQTDRRHHITTIIASPMLTTECHTQWKPINS